MLLARCVYEPAATSFGVRRLLRHRLRGLGRALLRLLRQRVAKLLEQARRRFAHALQVVTQRLKTGDTFTVRSGGGGGFGSPLERDPERVAFDVAEGYVTATEAREVYGVVLGADGRLDQAATAEQRLGMRGIAPQ